MKFASFQSASGDETRRVADRGSGGRAVRFGDLTLLIAGDDRWEEVSGRARRAGSDLSATGTVPDDHQVYLVRQKGRLFETEFPDVRVIHDGGRFLAVSMDNAELARVTGHASHCFQIGAMPDSGVVFERRPHRSGRGEATTWIRDLTAKVSAAEFRSTLAKVVSFPTRHAFSDHYRAAATLCRDTLSDLGYEAHLQSVPVGSDVAYNVIAKKLGTGVDPKLVIAMAHLDSINHRGGPSSTAPGADDNGSGSAAVIEIARVFRDLAPEHDLQLLLLGGEELGLFGSKHFVSNLPDNSRMRIATALNMDMIGGYNLDPPTVLIEAASQTVVDELADAADTFTTLTVETSLEPFASDHVPFIEAGIPAALTIEGADSRNHRIHSEEDTLAYVNAELAEQIIRMNVGYLARKLGRRDSA